MSERRVPTFLCGSDFNNSMLEKFVSFYNVCVADGTKDAIIYIDSPGGYVTVCNSMLSLMENTDIKFHTVCIGTAASCGLALLAGGDVRYATDRADIMFHDIAAGTWGHPDQMEDDIERMKKLGERFLKKFADKTKKTYKWWMDQYMKNPNRAFWFGANQAKTYGVVDKIGVPVESSNENLIVDVKK